MDTQAARTARWLGWGGVLPFAAAPVVALTPSPGWLERLVIAYGMVILAFMAGTLWARHLLINDVRLPMLVAANLLALLAWPAILLPLHVGALWLGALFAVHLVLDEPWRGHGQPGWYRRMRLALSITVITLLVLTGLIEAGRVL